MGVACIQFQHSFAIPVLTLTFPLLPFPQDDMDCPLCLEEMDISDLNFKPCACGYQVR